jgi:fructose-specific phosphotransferase system IIA component
MSDQLLLEGRITDKKLYLDSVLEREKLASTAVGFDVGIPHGKSQAVKTATVFFGRSDSGIKWNEEGEEVKLVFLLAIPSEAASNHHLKILAALSRKLMDESFIKLLKTGKSKMDILSSLEETLASVTV